MWSIRPEVIEDTGYCFGKHGCLEKLHTRIKIEFISEMEMSQDIKEIQISSLIMR